MTTYDYTDRMKAVAENLAVNPIAQATESLATHSLLPAHIDTATIEKVLGADMKALMENKDFHSLEKMLYGQALTLNGIFHVLVQKAGDSKENLKPYLDLALRFQKQTIRSVEIIHAFKNPRGTGVIQQHMTAQNIQVNTGTNELLNRENDNG